MNYKISLFLPTIRPHLLEKWYESLDKSCSLDFQVVFSGPFSIPDALREKSNVKYINTYASPTKAAHLAALECDGELIFHCTDDLIFLDNSIDEAIDLYDNNSFDIMNMRYVESENHQNKQSFPLFYWTVANSCQLQTLPPHWLTGAHFLCRKSLFVEMGGFDCQFEYLTHAAKDFLIRAQFEGASFTHSPKDISTADWSGASHSSDHKPIEIGQTFFDKPLYDRLWLTEYSTRRKIDINNYRNCPDIWSRRFGNTKPKTYQNLLNS